MARRRDGQAHQLCDPLDGYRARVNYMTQAKLVTDPGFQRSVGQTNSDVFIKRLSGGDARCLVRLRSRRLLEMEQRDHSRAQHKQTRNREPFAVRSQSHILTSHRLGAQLTIKSLRKIIQTAPTICSGQL